MTGFRRISQTLNRPMQRQVTDSDCAVWVIKAMCLQMGVSIPPARVVREHIDLDSVGTTVLGVRDALDHFGVNARPVSGPADAVVSAPLPAIAMIRINGAVLHYVVVLDATNRSVRYLDPAYGGIPRTVTNNEFASQFTGKLILCERKPDYTKVDFGKEVNARAFALKALLSEWNAALAFVFGELSQLTLLLVSVLLLKSYFSSSLQGAPNLWFLGGIALCAGIYVWLGRIKGLVGIQQKSSTLLGLLSLTTNAFRKSSRSVDASIRASSARCLKTVTSASSSIVSITRLPSSILSVVAFACLLLWFDLYAACYAVVVAVVLPGICLFVSGKSRSAKRDVACDRERVVLGLIHLTADRESKIESINDIGWGQISYCDSLATRDVWQSIESTAPVAVGRANVFAGLLIGGFQHQTMGMGHTIAVFILLSMFTSVVYQWSRQVALLPEHLHQIRGWLDFVSDLNPSATKYKALAESTNAGLDVSFAPEA